MALNVDFLVFLVTLTVLVGLVGDLITKRYSIPASVFLITFGYLLGRISLPAEIAVFPGTSSPLLPLPVLPFLTIAPLFANFALIMILFYGGLELKISNPLREIPRVLIQVNIYVLMGILTISSLTVLLLHWSIPIALLMGSIIGGETTAALIVPLTKIIKISEQTRAFLVLESTINSIYLIVFFFAFLSVIQGQNLAWLSLLIGIGTPILSGIVVGIAFGYAWRKISPAFSNFEFSYVLILVFVLGAFLVSGYFGGGVVSSLVFGYVIFRKSRPKKTRNGDQVKADSVTPLQNQETEDEGPSRDVNYLKRIHYELTFILKTFFFVLMGLLLTTIPTDTIYITFFYGGIFTLALLGIRFVASVISTVRSPLEADRNIILFTVAQGLTPAVLAVTALTDNVQNSPLILALTLAVILYTNIITIGSSVAARMQVNRNKQSTPQL